MVPATDQENYRHITIMNQRKGYQDNADPIANCSHQICPGKNRFPRMDLFVTFAKYLVL